MGGGGGGGRERERIDPMTHHTIQPLPYTNIFCVLTALCKTNINSAISEVIIKTDQIWCKNIILKVLPLLLTKLKQVVKHNTRIAAILI